MVFFLYLFRKEFIQRSPINSIHIYFLELAYFCKLNDFFLAKQGLALNSGYFMEQLHRYIICFLIVSGLGMSSLYSQGTIYTDDEIHITYEREVFGGAFFHTQGWGLNFVSNYFKTVDKRVNFEIQLNFTHNQKQKKIYNPYFRDARGYYYGKLNSFFQLRALYGQRKIIGHKIRSKGVEIGYSWGIGPSFGFLKPVYLEVINFDQNVLEVVKYDPEKHDLGNIYGRAGGINGFDEIKFKPGLYFKFGFFVEYSKKRLGISGIEAGVAIDAYFERIEIMAFVENQQFFPLLYINIFFGSKFNKY